MIHIKDINLDEENKNRINKILAQTDWEQYWEDVFNQSQPEINAYNLACIRSLARASTKILR